MGGLQRRVTGMLRAGWREANAILRTVWARSPITKRSVLYESFAGNGALCNPEAIFRHLLDSPDMADLHHTWVLNRSGGAPAFRAEFALNRRVHFVRRGTPAYFRALATREYLVNNATFPPEFAKRDGQIYLNTWHGTPLKRMGYDLPHGGALEAANTMRNFLSADFLLSQNDFMTRQMYEQAYRLLGVFAGKVLQEGYPRLDRQHLNLDQRATVEAQLARAGISLAGRQLVLYAPTWRGTDFASPEDTSDQIVATAHRLQRLLGSDRFVVALKAHQALHDRVATHPDGGSLLVPNDIPTNLILGITDALVTDYSSIFFDFLPLPGPIVFFAEDRMDYSRIRGTYFSADDLPGPVCTELELVADAITGDHPRAAEIGRRREEWRSRFAAKSDGEASRRVADVVFRGQPAGPDTVSCVPTTRTSILLHLGSLRSNGITSAALNLLGELDTPDLDVSVVFARPVGEGQAAHNQRRIPPHVRQFIRVPHAESRLGRVRRRLSFFFAQDPRRAARVRTSRGWSAQWNWCFGDVSFDHIIDFDGYGPFWANLLLRGPSRTHSIWLHNDMAAEQHRVVSGRQRIRRSLGAVFALYGQFDHLVSVSPALAELNRLSLATRFGIDPGAFVAARNIIDGRHVIEASLEGIRALESDPATVPPWWPELIDPQRRETWFVTVGRLSTEKNHARLIRAFALVHRERRDTRLLIVGDGPLRSDLVELAGSRGVADSVIFAGYLPNPYPAVASADCFVISSDYEGQPMVIMEAAIVGLPIISVDFTTVRDALPDGSIHVVDRTDDALAQGMLDFLQAPDVPVSFDFAAYNVVALAEFRSAATTPS